MLLPSDIARLVLGYLQQEGLSSTTQAFILESPDLKEYAEHSTEDGTIPACLFSLFGKNLTTILNEYVAVKAKETRQETPIPAMMTSLWKKLDFTLNQIKSMQNSPSVIHNQRVRTRNGTLNLRRQRALSTTQSPSSGFLSLSAPMSGHAVISPLQAPPGILGHSTPVCYTSQQTRPSPICSTAVQTQIQDGGRLLINLSRDSPLQIMVPDNRLTPGPLSPGRRKCDSPRRRGGGPSGSIGTGRTNMAASSLTAEPQSEETATENFPQMVIQNAREKILSDRSLQEKLADNINKILASDSSPQASKASCSTVEQDPSIDEILGLQGEIHMSDDAIHDILEQTESDPAFQALFDLFDYGKNKTSEDAVQGDGNISNSVQSEVTETRCVDSSSETAEPGTGEDIGPISRMGRTRSGQEPKSKKTRKSAPPVPSSSKATPGPSTRGARRGTSTTRLSAGNDKHAATSSSTEQDLERCNSGSIFNEDGAGMDIDEPLNTLPPESTAPLDVFEPVRQESTPTSTNTHVLACNTAVSRTSETRTASYGNNSLEHKNSQGSSDAQAESESQTPRNLPSNLSSPPSLFISTPLLDQSNKASTQNVNLPHGNIAPPNSKGISQPQPVVIPSVAVPTAVTTTPAGPTFLPSPPGKEVDPSKIVALKIIISDEQEEPSSDSALTQAVSSITGDRIPTIFLSSPAKSPAKAPALTGAPLALDETVQAVSSLQRTEVLQPEEANPLSGKAEVVAAVAGTSYARPGDLAQPTYYIQLPFDSANPTYGAPTSSFFLVTDPGATDPQGTKVVLSSGISQGQTVTPTSYALATPPRSHTYSSGSTVFISSPVQPILQSMMVPVSVVGQNNAGMYPMVPNQLITMPNPASVKQPAPVKSQTKLAPKDTTVSGKTGASGSSAIIKVFHQVSSGSKGQQKATAAAAGSSPSHRRMLCFDGSADETTTQTTKTVSSPKAPATGTTVSPPVKHVEKDNPKQAVAKPTTSSASRPKRRIETVRCTDKTQTSWTATETETSSTPLQQKEAAKTHSNKTNDQTARADSASTSKADSSQSESSSRSESRRRLTSTEKGNGLAGNKDTSSSKASSSDHRLRSGSRKDKEDTSRQEPSENSPAKVREGRAERKSSSQEPPHVTANKENELEGSRREQQPTLPAAPREFSTAPVTPPTPAPQVNTSKILSKTSPLTKQAAEMLHDIQGFNPPSTPPKKLGMGCPELPLPKMPGPSRLQEESLDSPRTPARQRQGRDREGTPSRHLVPPATPDLPSCSPASEAGSENSINMAAHTLMILSRAAIARTGTPLKDSLRQEGAGTVTPAASKSKKRKQPEPVTSPSAKKEPQLSSSSDSKKKAKKQKKQLDNFPDDLDVDKFLSSLHYDE